MTREEAIEVIEQDIPCEHDTDLIEALEMAIKALEQEPCDDVIDREYLFKILDDFCGHDRTATITLDTLADLVYDMPPVTQKPIECDDVVSRQDALNAVTFSEVRWQAIERIKQLPSVRPQEQTGKCRTCKYGEIYNDLWCKCHDPLLDGVMVKMTDQCRAEEIIDLNRKYREERSDKE